MNRSLKLSMLMALALGSSQVLALDLGQIQVKSALGQPLLAEIPLRPANPAELQNLSVQLASSEDFARAGISGGRTTIPLHFSVANAGSDHPVIRITSSVAVDDPYLDLLIEVNSRAAGKSVREFAILLDPPGTSSAAAATAAQTRIEHRSEPVAPRRPAAAAPAPAPQAARAATAGNGQYGPVEHGQTLSSIARSTAPGGIDVQQMMLALKQANPEAFYRDNINALKSGAVLRVPTAAEAQAMTIAAAIAEVRRQNSDWRAGTPAKPAVVAEAATRASTPGAPANTTAGSGDRLALVQAKDLKGGGNNDKSAASLRQDLLRTQESLASLQQQGADLKTRLTDLTDINSKNERLLSLKDSEIAELQNKLAAARKAAGLPAAAMPATAATVVRAATAVGVATASSRAKPESAPAATAAAASATPVATTTPSAAASTTTPAKASTAAAAKPVAATKPATRHLAPPAPAPVAEQPWYMQTWAWAAGAGAIVLLLLLAALGRKRKPAAAKSATSLADRFDTASSTEPGFAGSDDVDQEELLDQLAEHPDDIGLHLELVTLYYSRRDVDHFEAAAEAMHAHITDPQQDEWQDVVHMGEDLVPGHPLFDHHVELPAHDEAEARHAFDIDDYAGDHRAAAEAPSMPPPLPSQAPKKVSEYSFNFDLTHPPATDAAALKGAAADHAEVTQASGAYAPPAHEAPAAGASASDWHFDDAASAHHVDDHGSDLGEFNDDPVDTKLDLARAYVDMGDADGARAMLSEVMKEGSQMQQDVAKRLLDTLH